MSNLTQILKVKHSRIYKKTGYGIISIKAIGVRMLRTKLRDRKSRLGRSGMSLVTVLMGFFSVTTLMYWTTGAITNMNANIIKVQAKDAINKFQTNLQAFLIQNAQGWENSVAACYGPNTYKTYYNDGVYGDNAGLDCLRKREDCTATIVGMKTALIIKGGSHRPEVPDEHFFFNPGNSSSFVSTGWAFTTEWYPYGPVQTFNPAEFNQHGGGKKHHQDFTTYRNGFGTDGFPCKRSSEYSADANRGCPFWAAVWVEKHADNPNNVRCPEWKISVNFAYNPGKSPADDLENTYQGIIDAKKYDYSFVRSSQGASMCTTPDYGGPGGVGQILQPLKPCG